jgi:two-component system KDP operon response regulator KdpE
MVAVKGEQSRQILIVEDDADTAEYVAELLETHGFSTVSVDTGTTALSELQSSTPALVLLDLNLPDMKGMEVLKLVREQSFLPLIILSGFSQERDKVTVLEAGADDFLVKPFSPQELVARVGALLRRVEWTPIPEPKLVVRSLELDLARRQATMRSKKLHLTPIEYGILVTLMRVAGAVVSHDELLRTVWGEQYEGDYSVLRVNISRLRQKLEENPRHPTYVVTVPGQGYTMPVRKT